MCVGVGIDSRYNVGHPVVCCNNGIPKKNQSNTSLILQRKSEVVTCFGLSRGHHQVIR
jgi:hypothetical protein